MNSGADHGQTRENQLTWTIPPRNPALSGLVSRSRDQQGKTYKWLDANALSDGAFYASFESIANLAAVHPNKLSVAMIGSVALVLSAQGQANLRASHLDSETRKTHEALTQKAVGVVNRLLQRTYRKVCPELIEGVLNARSLRVSDDNGTRFDDDLRELIDDTLLMAQIRDFVFLKRPAHAADMPVPGQRPTDTADSKYRTQIRMVAMELGFRPTIPAGYTRGQAFSLLTDLQRRAECMKLGLPPDTPWRQVIRAQQAAYRMEGKLEGRLLPTRREMLTAYLENRSEKRNAKTLYKRNAKLLSDYEKAHQEWVEYQEKHPRRQHKQRGKKNPVSEAKP